MVAVVMELGCANKIGGVSGHGGGQHGWWLAIPTLCGPLCSLAVLYWCNAGVPTPSSQLLVKGLALLLLWLGLGGGTSTGGGGGGGEKPRGAKCLSLPHCVLHLHEPHTTLAAAMQKAGEGVEAVVRCVSD